MSFERQTDLGVLDTPAGGLIPVAAERRPGLREIGMRLDNMGLSVRTNAAARGCFGRIITPPLVASALRALSIWVLAL